MKKRSLAVFCWLLWQELRVFFQDFFANAFDAILFPAAIVVVSSYILPHMGIDANYGSFILVGTMTSMCLFNAINKAQVMVADMEGTNSISYQLALPLPAWLLFIKVGIGFALTSLFLNIFTLPIGKVLLGSLFSLQHLSLIKLFVVFITINIFFGFYGLWIASWVKKSMNFPHIWMRFVLILWTFGCYQYSWMILHKAYPFWSYVSLFNPMIYAFEASRVAVLGQDGLLHFWFCIGMLWLFIIIFYGHALMKFKKRLDYV
jgi:hypothetical protein